MILIVDVMDGSPTGPNAPAVLVLITKLLNAFKVSAPEPAGQASTGASLFAAVIASTSEQLPFTMLSTAPGVTLMTAAFAGGAHSASTTRDTVEMNRFRMARMRGPYSFGRALRGYEGAGGDESQMPISLMQYGVVDGQSPSVTQPHASVLNSLQ